MSNVTPIQSSLVFTESEQQIAQEIQTRIEIESQGTLNDFSSASPLSAIAEGQAYAIALLGESVNNLPDRFVEKYFEVLGLSRSNSRPAVVPIEFTKTTGYVRDVTIPEKFRMFTEDGIVFTLDSSVTISEETPRAIGFATSVGVGTSNNVPENSINNYSLAIPGLDSITNPVEAKGATDQESLPQALSRGLSFLTFRHLLTPLDFERATSALLNRNYVVKALSYEEIQRYIFDNDRFLQEDSQDDISRRNVYLIISDNSGLGINSALQNKIKNYLLPRLQSGTEIKFLKPNRIDLRIGVTCRNSPSESVINRMISTLRLNQAVTYRSIGQNLNNSDIYEVINSFFSIENLVTSVVDGRGEAIFQYEGQNGSLLAPYPTSVFVLDNINVTTASGVKYEYNQPK